MRANPLLALIIAAGLTAAAVPSYAQTTTTPPATTDTATPPATTDTGAGTTTVADADDDGMDWGWLGLLGLLGLAGLSGRRRHVDTVTTTRRP